jgi:hypothetical protein
MGSALAFAVPGLAPRLALSQERPPLFPGPPAGVYDTAMLDTLPEKQPLIKLSYRPPNYETPVSYFKTAITPNDAFFVRYHFADIHRGSQRKEYRRPYALVTQGMLGPQSGFAMANLLRHRWLGSRLSRYLPASQ